MKNFWTADELEYLRKNYANNSTQFIAKQLKRPISTVYGKANSLGIKKSHEFLNSPESGRLYPGSNIGKSTRFKKGAAPHNKGKKMSAELKEKVKHTFFKKGHKPYNTQKDGAITIRDGYKYLRLAENNWVLLHRHLWEQSNGPIKPKHNVIFKDGNSFNCDIANLEMVSDAELMLKNTIHNYPEEMCIAFRTLGRLNAKINKYEKQDI